MCTNRCAGSVQIETVRSEETVFRIGVDVLRQLEFQASHHLIRLIAAVESQIKWLLARR